ncbi:hypothetical protein [Streptomyces megasporus]|uniref:hypothetical protein n=1 Tax=Streptomyces megasporus TaxID=44060 RepID=UPI0004E1A9CE|nr:hypothetical protein [Streptomyces megasporus]
MSAAVGSGAVPGTVSGSGRRAPATSRRAVSAALASAATSSSRPSSARDTIRLVERRTAP